MPTSVGSTHSHSPSKRPRKAINCQPCRSSKLKCDRARPCSSCVLRGTSALCYPDGRPECDDDTRTDPLVEIQRIRHSLSLLETHLSRSGTAPVTDGHSQSAPPAPAPDPHPISHHPTSDSSDKYFNDKCIPGAFASQTFTGFYAGPTSSLAFMGDLKEFESPHNASNHREPLTTSSAPETMSFIDEQADRELVNRLPDFHVIDQALLFYLENCSFTNLCIHRSTLLNNWENFKNGRVRTRLTLSLIFGVIASTIQFIPPQNQLLMYLRLEQTGSATELSDWYYEQSCIALSLHEGDSATPSLDLVELYLVQIVYLGINKTRPEEIWRLRGQVTSLALALGLHRDPSNWSIVHPLAERRRWAWFSVLQVERWHAFMLGRPGSFRNNQFDTTFPSSIDPGDTDSSTSMDHLPHIHMFKLMIMYGDIMDDVLSVHPVAHEVIMAHHQAVEEWLDSFPPELRFDNDRLAPIFALNNPTLCRRGVQALCLKMAGLNTQLTLHRPFATMPSQLRNEESSQLAIVAASTIIFLTTSARPNYLNNPLLTVPGHIHWGVMLLFAAIMFLISQEIEGRSETRSHSTTIKNGVIDLEALRGIPAADKAIQILRNLRPLYELDTSERDTSATKRRKDEIIKETSRLPFPFLDPPSPRSKRRARVTHFATPPTLQQPPSRPSSSDGSRDRSNHVIAPLAQHQRLINEAQNGFIGQRYGSTEDTNGLYIDHNVAFPPAQSLDTSDGVFWPSAVAVETNEWARMMRGGLPKTKP